MDRLKYIWNLIRNIDQDMVSLRIEDKNKLAQIKADIYDIEETLKEEIDVRNRGNVNDNSNPAALLVSGEVDGDRLSSESSYKLMESINAMDRELKKLTDLVQKAGVSGAMHQKQEVITHTTKNFAEQVAPANVSASRTGYRNDGGEPGISIKPAASTGPISKLFIKTGLPERSVEPLNAKPQSTILEEAQVEPELKTEAAQFAPQSEVKPDCTSHTPGKPSLSADMQKFVEQCNDDWIRVPKLTIVKNILEERIKNPHGYKGEAVSRGVLLEKTEGQGYYVCAEIPGDPGHYYVVPLGSSIFTKDNIYKFCYEDFFKFNTLEGSSNSQKILIRPAVFEVNRDGFYQLVERGELELR